MPTLCRDGRQSMHQWESCTRRRHSKRRVLFMWLLLLRRANDTTKYHPVCKVTSAMIAYDTKVEGMYDSLQNTQIETTSPKSPTAEQQWRKWSTAVYTYANEPDVMLLLNPLWNHIIYMNTKGRVPRLDEDSRSSLHAHTTFCHNHTPSY